MRNLGVIISALESEGVPLENELFVLYDTNWSVRQEKKEEDEKERVLNNSSGGEGVEVALIAIITI